MNRSSHTLYVWVNFYFKNFRKNTFRINEIENLLVYIIELIISENDLYQVIETVGINCSGTIDMNASTLLVAV